MALTNAEAAAINALLRWQLYGSEPDPYYGRAVGEDVARNAALFLAARAHAKLMAGLRPADVEERWEEPE